MKILTIINGLNNGGAEKFAVELCNELSKKHEVYLMVKSPIDSNMIPPKKLNGKVKLLVFNSKFKWDIVFFFKLIRLLFKLKPNIIHLHSSILFFYTFFYPIVFTSSRLFHTIHTEVTPAYRKVFKWASVLSYLGCRMTHIAISYKIKSEFERVFESIPFIAIENGVEPLISKMRPEIRWKDTRKRLVAIGNFTSAKRFDLLSDVLAMPEISPFFTLQIIGNERSSDQKVTQYIQSKNAENIELVGLKENVGDYLNCADGLVIWSGFEGMPLVMLEALSISCPVISSPVGGIPDVIESGKHGILTKGLAQKDLKEALIQFGQMSQMEIEVMRKNCKELFEEKFTMSICAKKYESVFSSQL